MRVWACEEGYHGVKHHQIIVDRRQVSAHPMAALEYGH
uniref:Uncharacterized protein n=1 Tax=Ralstonia solanacearum TaxID=305 RepID=A0A0S4UWS2_RALSL|nr:protein of unknown function [Ralstonia solanacearum]CUV37273.1 protein of unknown function [Ralstonia solanacearum]CUV43028.1 protein of unknown function [Ralstonia solanacearum]CUV62615.1 protein of unknown function [Ralstonia solanacearum]